MNVEHVPSAGDLAQRGAELIATAMRSAVSERGRFLIALSGGNTPKPVYERLTQSPYGKGLPWADTLVFFGDERMVPPDHDQSNFHMACETLLNHVDVPPWNIRRIEGEMQADVAARWYDRQLRGLTPDENSLPRFDLILLGLGPDGHTASLFPGTDVLNNTTDLAAPVTLPESSAGAKQARDRVTMTYPVLDAARSILFLVSGSDKAEALDRVQRDDQSAPAARVRPADGSILWLVAP